MGDICKDDIFDFYTSIFYINLLRRNFDDTQNSVVSVSSLVPKQHLRNPYWNFRKIFNRTKTTFCTGRPVNHDKLKRTVGDPLINYGRNPSKTLKFKYRFPFGFFKAVEYFGFRMFFFQIATRRMKKNII